MTNLEFWKGKKVFLTGHTGFKGSWLSFVLLNAGAELTGYALDPPTDPSLFSFLNLGNEMSSITGDIRDLENLEQAFRKSNPEIVIHMAAQPIVRDSYQQPVYTYATNVMGTVNILECVRKSKDKVKSVVNVTTDKVYLNHEWVWGYRENDILDGHDPYSNSKSCSELVTHSYCRSFFDDGGTAISTARAGNVIGGGDFANDRIIPDCVKAVLSDSTIVIRNPYSIRPYQHVLDPIYAYLLIAQQQWENPSLAGSYNVGPNESDCITTGELATMFCEAWGDGARWENRWDGGPHEASFLKLDCSKIKGTFDWSPRWNIKTAIDKTVEWSKTLQAKGNLWKIMKKQNNEFLHR